MAIALLTMSTFGTGLTYAATTRGHAEANQTVTSGSWKVEPSSSIFTLLDANAPPAPEYATVTNTGTLTLVGTTYTLSSVGLLAGTVSLKSCSGTWNENTHACTGGTTTTLVTNTAASPSASAPVTTNGQFPAAPDGTVRLQVTLNLPAAGAVVVTLTVTANRSQARAATTTTS